MRKTSFFNLFFRGLTILSKFFLSILIINKLGPTDLGVFGLFQTSVTLGTFIIGLDFYSYNTREILSKNSDKNIKFYLINQLFLHFLTYIFFSPILLVFLMNSDLNFENSMFFVFILFFEHISQELYRILITFQKSLVATISLFIRSGIWVVLLFVLWEFSSHKISLSSILFIWMLFSLSSILFSIFFLKEFFTKTEIANIDLNWIKKGIFISFPFFLTTISYKLMEFSGRYFIDYFSTKEQVGIYTLYFSISNTLFVLLHSTVIIVYSPKLIMASNENFVEFQKVFSLFQKKMLIALFAGFALMLIMSYPLFYLLNKPYLLNNFHVFITLLVSTAFFCVSYIPHYALYTFKFDKILFTTTLVSSICVLFFNFLLIPFFDIFGAALAQMIGFFLIYFLKNRYWNKKKMEINKTL